MEKKRGRMKGLLGAGTDCEPQYLVRLLQVVVRSLSSRIIRDWFYEKI
jgi:hypothetical protein